MTYAVCVCLCLGAFHDTLAIMKGQQYSQADVQLQPEQWPLKSLETFEINRFRRQGSGLQNNPVVQIILSPKN